MQLKLTKELEEAFERARQEAGDPQSPAELDRLYRQVNRSPVEVVTVGTENGTEKGGP
jgi:hypothetical protein